MPLLRVGIVTAALVLSVVGSNQTQVRSTKAETFVSCPITVVPEPPPYGLAKAGLLSLWYANSASERGKEITEETKRSNSEFAVVTGMMRTTKLATNDFICAKQPLKPFATKRSDEPTRLAAVSLLVAYDQHIDINRRLVELLKNMDNMKQPELMDQISTLQVERGQRWSDLVQPTSLILMLLINSARSDEQGGTRWLKITKAQKQGLLDWAYEHFPEFKNGTPREQWSDPLKTAELYLTLLNGHRGSDEAIQK